MKFFTALVITTTAALASTAVVVSSSKIDTAAAVVDGLGNIVNNDAAPTNNVPGSGGKPSAAQHRAQKSTRMAERRARVKAAIANLPNEPNSQLERMNEGELEKAYLAAEESAKLRGLKRNAEDGNANDNPGGGFIRKATQELKESQQQQEDLGRKLWGNGGNGNPYEPAGGLAEETNYYDKWSQAYRFLGGYIDCSHSWGGGSQDSGDNNGGEGGGACSRWMMWAAYTDPNYAGGGYDEYFGDDAPGSLDCHSPDTDWKLIGVYRQEFYQYIEQISKHLWAIDEYEYIVALAGLEYMTGDECFGVGYDENGNQLYAAIQPLTGGMFQMGLYSEAQCITLNTVTSYTYDDFAEGSELDLGSKDATDDDAFRNQAYEYWQETQEYTMTNLNTVYNDYKFCTSCVDYPTYQDGYFIGDDGTDDDDLINQCWKFYSHDSYNCDGDCIAMGAEQGSITWISYNGKQFGTLVDGQYSASHDKNVLGEGGISAVSTSSSGSQRIERLKANLFLTFAGIVFVATFLAFAVARGSSKKKKKSSRSRSRRLLDADYGGTDGRRSASRSQSRSRKLASSGGDNKSVRSSRSKSKSRTSSGKSVKSSRSKSRTRRSDYEPPASSTSEKKSRSQSRSRKTSGSSSRRRESGRDEV
mmetsp:Transcript_16430/g.35517  ORF Transcript_16430/g.35517 Transcript_16430/m.35517 type:complete len:643 (+) Transcript_16430:331-2259(+)